MQFFLLNPPTSSTAGPGTETSTIWAKLSLEHEGIHCVAGSKMLQSENVGNSSKTMWRKLVFLEVYLIRVFFPAQPTCQ